MKELLIEATSSTPEIKFFPSENIFRISGISSPEDSRTLYYPVIHWFQEFSGEISGNAGSVFSQENPLKFRIDLAYFNSSSAKFLFDLLTELKLIKQKGIPVVIEWHYEAGDTDLMEAGMDISLIAEIELNFIEKEAKV